MKAVILVSHTYIFTHSSDRAIRTPMFFVRYKSFSRTTIMFGCEACAFVANGYL